ncbi:VanZ family protein [Mesorhizobium sp. SP-1A]|uniref:VanZ family protein n=1 Tax=Mesorhizobium sp. SP-1A TaxID=3077840 RepID=UPI0028F70EC5|nr:VanZ family protein [Mesorhizobium sp. SP-1A]
MTSAVIANSYRLMILASRLTAILLLLFIAFATLSPIDLRPHIGNANLERAAAYFVFGFALAVGFPGRFSRSALFVVAVAFSLEALQLIDPSRHGRLHDAVIKAAAGLIGVAVVWIASQRLAWLAGDRKG